MTTEQELQDFLTVYMRMRKLQREHFKFKSKTVHKGCILLEQNLDAQAQKLMIDLGMNLSIAAESPKLF